MWRGVGGIQLTCTGRHTSLVKWVKREASFLCSWRERLEDDERVGLLIPSRHWTTWIRLTSDKRMGDWYVHGLKLVYGYPLEGQQLHLWESIHLHVCEGQHSSRVTFPFTLSLEKRERVRKWGRERTAYVRGSEEGETELLYSCDWVSKASLPHRLECV